MFAHLERCMIESRIGRRLVFKAPRPMPGNPESLVYELAPATADGTLNATEIARFLAYVERSAPANTVASRIRLNRPRGGDPDADAWSPTLSVTRVGTDSRASRSSALATWARLTRAVGKSPSVRRGADLTELDIAVEQDGTSIRASGTVASNQVYTDLIDILRSLPASADVTPGATRPGDASVEFTDLSARLENE
ncbi:MAG: hypothetical protein ACYTG2_17495 [Planctomycetota bacterium]